MTDEKTIAEWRKYRRHSLRVLPVEIGLLVAACVILFVLNLWVDVPPWITIIVVAMSAFTVIGDIVNIAYLSWKLSR